MQLTNQKCYSRGIRLTTTFCYRASTTSQSDARSARTPRNPAWRVEVVEEEAAAEVAVVISEADAVEEVNIQIE